MLLVTDRPMHATALAGILNVLEPCSVIALGQPFEVIPGHTVVICDVDVSTQKIIADTKALLALHRVVRVSPVLLLARWEGEAALTQADLIGATAVLSHKASPAQILFTVRRLLESREKSRLKPACASDPVISANIRQAGAVYAEALDALRSGESISVAALERGSTAVMTAVGGGRISAWLDVVRSYDDITYQHCLLVACFAVTFSARLGISFTGQRQISRAALLHDIGKLRIDREILNKPGKLTETEMDIVRQHPSIGHGMLVRQGGFDQKTLDMVLHHHEFMDGSGYPDGLVGSQISSMVRLLTICDIYAALIERRSYKAPMPQPEALGILRCMGAKLDRRLLEVFQGMIEA